MADIFEFALEERAETAKGEKYNHMANIKECLEEAMQKRRHSDLPGSSISHHLAVERPPRPVPPSGSQAGSGQPGAGALQADPTRRITETIRPELPRLLESSAPWPPTRRKALGRGKVCSVGSVISVCSVFSLPAYPATIHSLGLSLRRAWLGGRSHRAAPCFDDGERIEASGDSERMP